MKKFFILLLLLTGCAGTDRAPPTEVIPEPPVNIFVITRRGESHPNTAALQDIYVLRGYEPQAGAARLLDMTADALMATESEARQILELHAERLQAELFLN